MIATTKASSVSREQGAYARRPPLVLINGLAEQSESWFANVECWRRHFDVYQPNLVVYEGAALHERIEHDLPIDVEYFVEQLHVYLSQFAQAPPYYLVGNSMGGKIAVEYAVRHPHQVAKLVLLCPSGLSDQERLPMIEGVRRNDPRTIVESVFHDPRLVDPGLVDYYASKFRSRRWKTAALRTIRGTMDHRVRDLLPEVTQPTLVVVGDADRVVDPLQTIQAAARLPRGRVHVLAQCGHAPQMEKASLVNDLVVDFLRDAADG